MLGCAEATKNVDALGYEVDNIEKFEVAKELI